MSTKQQRATVSSTTAATTRGVDPDGSYVKYLVYPSDRTQSIMDASNDMTAKKPPVALRSNVACQDRDGLAFICPTMSLDPPEELSVTTERNEALSPSLALSLKQSVNKDSTHRRSPVPISRPAEQPCQKVAPMEEDIPDTVTGKALAFTQMIVANHERMVERFQKDDRTAYLTDELSLVDADDLLFHAERMLHRQEAFAKAAKSSLVDIGYHFLSTEEEGDGPCSCTRMDQVMTTRSRGDSAPFGDGIYTSNNPFAAIEGKANSTGTLVVVARLKGQIKFTHGVYDCSLGNVDEFREVCVLLKSSQCTPLLRIDPSLIDLEQDGADGNEMIYRYHRELQVIVDVFFNNGQAKSVLRVFPSELKISRAVNAPITSTSDRNVEISRLRNLAIERPPLILQRRQASPTRDSPQTRNSNSPNQSNMQTMVHLARWRSVNAAAPTIVPLTPPAPKSPTLMAVLYYTAPTFVDEKLCLPTQADLVKSLFADQPKADACLLCQKDLQRGGAVCRLPNCSHEFHARCLHKKLRRTYKENCPTCESDVGPLPVGSMLVDASSKPPTLLIDADIDVGSRAPLIGREQMLRHCGTSTTYLSIVPASKEKDEENMLNFAFSYVCGSTFNFRIVNESDKDPLTSMFSNLELLKQIQERAAKHSKKCASCRNFVGTKEERIILGVMPSGSMRVDYDPQLTCEGHAPGTFVISYRVHHGLQANYHACPGEEHGSAYREAYLPGEDDGKDLLKRLVFAFSRGMTFKVGTSISSGEKNAITWASVLHKTSVTPGIFGFPDRTYYDVANKQLDALGVPSAKDS